LRKIIQDKIRNKYHKKIKYMKINKLIKIRMKISILIMILIIIIIMIMIMIKIKIKIMITVFMFPKNRIMNKMKKKFIMKITKLMTIKKM
jgi:hypothetical protein